MEVTRPFVRVVLRHTQTFNHHLYTLVAQTVKCASNVRDPGLIPELGRSPGEGNGNPLQYSCLENSVDRGDL